MIDTTQKLFKIFADRNRLRIFKLLEQRKMCVCELAYVLSVTQPSVSRHLKKMKEAGLIETEQDGFWTNYFLRKGSKAQESVACCIKSLLKGDSVIKEDLRKLKMVNRTKLCCR
ncbi:MAG: winged helix-turn-helix transcriptional regulator [Candidatus Omnitrophica bacterium]|nr:winged helix-turn-helix transcriptional regulator [Candidatus Omnitrophota bacterium]